MYKFGLIGYPLSHSMSKVIQEAALHSVGVDGTYDILETPEEDLVSRIKYLRANKYAGFNVTIPLKVPVTLFLDEVDNIANVAGSANTIKLMPDMSLKGYNTDVFGFTEAIPEDIRKSLKGKSVAVLGCGGAARAVAVGLSTLKVKKIDFYVRNIINSSETANILRSRFPETEMNCKQTESLVSLKDYDMLVNTTPIGMKSKAPGISPIDEKILKTIKKDGIVYDIVYNPLKTELIKQSAANGLYTIKGLDMLIYQGAKAFEIWTGKYPDVAKMKIAALEEMAE